LKNYNDNFKKNGRKPPKKMEEDLQKKMEDNLKETEDKPIN
jgi:hypothetical protein